MFIHQTFIEDLSYARQRCVLGMLSAIKQPKANYSVYCIETSIRYTLSACFVLTFINYSSACLLPGTVLGILDIMTDYVWPKTTVGNNLDWNCHI